MTDEDEEEAGEFPVDTPESDAEEVIDQAEQEDQTATTEQRYTISSYGADYPADAVVQRLNSGAIRIPLFQRKYVWSTSEASKFIESLLLGLPVPGIFLAKEADSQRLLVVDGQQRLRTLQYFFAGRFEPKTPGKKGRKFKLIGVSRDFAGKTYDKLDEKDRLRLNDAIIHATVVKQDWPAADMTGIYQIFQRLNTGGMKLYAQEIRASIYAGEFNEVLADLNKRPSWRSIYGVESKRMKDRELILRFFTLYYSPDNYTRPMEQALNKFSQANKDLKTIPRQALEASFGSTIDLWHKAVGPKVFRPVKALNAAVFDAAMVGLARRLEQSATPDLDRLQAAYLELIKDPEFVGAYERSTADDEQVKTRLRVATRILGAT